MGAQVFPEHGSFNTGSLPGLDVNIERESIYSSTIYTSASGKEQRTSWWASPRFRYNLTYNVLRTYVSAPAPWDSDSEIGVVLQFLDDHLGPYDSFLFQDPYDGIQRTVRFESDTLTIQQVVKGVWQVKFSLLSLK
jgi:Conserved hypothetical protein 2217 (DUF2460)